MRFINSVEELHSLARNNREAYLSARPFPNIYFDTFFNEGSLSEVLDEFPDLSKEPDLSFDDPNQVKLASVGEYRFGEKTKDFMRFLNSQPFLEFRSLLTGIGGLIADPYFDGGGAHQIMPGGLLKIHADFNKSMQINLDRRLNVLVYLNKDWNEEWGGHLELWDREMKGVEKKILPIFNRLAVFTTTDFSYHGHPDPLKCPPDRSRKSVALYYYTNGRPPEEVSALGVHTTLFQIRPDSPEEHAALLKAASDSRAKRTSMAKEVIRQITPPLLYNVAKKLVRSVWRGESVRQR